MRHPVVLVHGYGGTGFPYWIAMHLRLIRDGYKPHVISLPGFGLGDIRNSSKALARFLDGIDSPDGKLDIIGHSEGGLVARYYIKFLGGAQKIHLCITLGTPHKGTYAGYLGWFTTAARQMIPGSEFLRELNSAPDPELKYYSILSLTDEMIIPKLNAIWDGAKNILVPICGHLGLIFSGRVYSIVKQILDSEHSDC